MRVNAHQVFNGAWSSGLSVYLISRPGFNSSSIRTKNLKVGIHSFPA